MPEAVVLVVDDEPGIIRLCRRLLEKAGFRVLADTDPKVGSLIIEKEQVDLLLVDIRMPGMDGFQLIELARSHQPDLAVVIMTGFGTVETAIEALRRGADALVLKPFSGAELVDSVQRALRESKQKQDVLRLQTLRPLFTISETLFSETNQERLYELLLDAVCGNLRCNYAGLYQRKLEENRYYLLTSRGELLPETEDDTDKSLLSYVVGWKTPLSINREGPGDAELQSILEERGFESVICAPLFTKQGDKFLIAVRSREEDVFRASDLEIFAILTRQAAVALENARLHTELRAYIRQVEESQRALIQAEKLSIAGRLTASIAHEINNPLQAVQNCLHLAGRSELPSDTRENYLVLAQTEMERLMVTVQRMLEYYRPGAIDRKPVDMKELIDRVILLVKQQLDEHKVNIHTRFPSRIPSVMAVGDQIQQVLLNLILNAMEAMQQGGDLFIEFWARKDRLEIIIEDTGPGVSAAQAERIFEPFVSTKEGGTGLGLAVSYGIISAHGGNLELIDGRGRGACFRITLPAGDKT